MLTFLEGRIMKVKHSPIAIKYCKDNKIPILEFQERFDKDLNRVTGLVAKFLKEK